jgi:hypothetical protein
VKEMNTYNAQNPSEMLHLLFDGELDSSLETPLYASLMQNEDLRSELRELIAIRDSIRKDVEAYTPPVVATQGIFSKLGYTPPIIPKATVSNTTSFWSNFGQKLWNPAVSAILASVITALFFMNYYQNENTNSSVYNNKMQPTMTKSAVIAQNGNVANDDIANQSLKNERVIIKERIKYVYVTNNESNKSNISENDKILTGTTPEITGTSNEISTGKNTQENTLSDDSKSWLSMINPVPFFGIESSIIRQNQLKNQNNSSREFILSDNFYPEQEKGHSLMMQFKAMSGASFPNVQIENLADNVIKNFSFGAFVPMTENFHLGIEGGQEPFSQVFHHVEDNTLYRIEQNPTLWWLGIGFKYNWDKHIEFLANAQPFINLTIASTKVGPYGKAIAGLQFVSDNGIGIMLGIDGGSLIYQEQKRFYSTEKLGITYGMFMRF